VFVLLGGMLDTQNNDFLRFAVGRVIDQIAVALRYELAHVLDILSPPDMGKPNEALQRFQNGSPHASAAGGFRSRI
jgi:hypothetical protein